MIAALSAAGLSAGLSARPSRAYAPAAAAMLSWTNVRRLTVIAATIARPQRTS
jgi:hypothetical protein